LGHAGDQEIAPTGTFGFRRRGDFQSPAGPSECCAERARRKRGSRRSPLRGCWVSVVGAISNRPTFRWSVGTCGRSEIAPTGTLGFRRRGDFQSPDVPSECCAERVRRKRGSGRSPLRITWVSVVGAISNRPPVLAAYLRARRKRGSRRSPLRGCWVSVVGAISNRPTFRWSVGTCGRSGDRPYGGVGFPS